jgi:hypothetical protein
MNTEELLNLEPLDVPWCDNIDEFDVDVDEPPEEIDEFALEVEREIERGKQTLNEVEFKQGEIIRDNPAIKDVLAKPQKQKVMPWE